ncbi:TetR/AcrR family transcriptional regulator [Rhodococcus sp. NPDC003348]
MSTRRIGAPDAKNRGVLLDAAEELLLEEGYAAVTSRRVAQKAGLKPQLVYYYFRTMDELLLEMFQRRSDMGLEYQARLMKSPQPLRALWEFSTDPNAVVVTMEFIAMANHRPKIRQAIADYSERFRAAQAEALAEILPRYGVDPDYTPEVVSVLITSLSRVLVMESHLGMAGGHEESFALVEKFLEQYEGPREDGPLA